jgi:hypothetical protein
LEALSVIDGNNYEFCKVDSVVSPPDIGHLPFKIASGFADFTANQWKTIRFIDGSCSTATL